MSSDLIMVESAQPIEQNGHVVRNGHSCCPGDVPKPLITLGKEESNLRDQIQSDVLYPIPDFEELCFNKGPW